MRKIKLYLFIVVILSIMGGGLNSLHSQLYTLKNADSTVVDKTLGSKYTYTYLYINSVRPSGDDSLRIFTYNSALGTWMDAKLINITLNTETTSGSPITIRGTNYIFAFYELYLSGFKVVRTNWVSGNDTTLTVYAKNVGSR